MYEKSPIPGLVFIYFKDREIKAIQTPALDIGLVYDVTDLFAKSS